MADVEGKKLTELRVIDLKTELERRGLDKSGNKAALLERLSKAILDEGGNPEEHLIVPSGGSPKIIPKRNGGIQGWPYSTERSGNTVTFDRDVRWSNDVAHLKRQSKEIFAMQQYTPRERSQIIEIYIQQNKSIVKTQRAWRKINKVKSAPSANTLYRLYERFSTGEALTNPKRPNKMRPRRSDDNIALVQASVQRSPTTSQTRRSKQLGIKRTTLRRILHHDLHLFPYKVQLTQKQAKDP